MTLRVLIDENLPVGIHRWFPHGTAETVERNAWKELKNGVLLRQAVAAGFTVLLTADRAMYREHDFSSLPLGLVVVPTNRWRALQAMRSAIVAAVVAAKPGDYVELPWSCDPSKLPLSQALISAAGHRQVSGESLVRGLSEGVKLGMMRSRHRTGRKVPSSWRRQNDSWVKRRPLISE